MVTYLEWFLNIYCRPQGYYFEGSVVQWFLPELYLLQDDHRYTFGHVLYYVMLMLTLGVSDIGIQYLMLNKYED